MRALMRARFRNLDGYKPTSNLTSNRVKLLNYEHHLT